MSLMSCCYRWQECVLYRYCCWDNQQQISQNMKECSFKKIFYDDEFWLIHYKSVQHRKMKARWEPNYELIDWFERRFMK